MKITVLVILIFYSFHSIGAETDTLKLLHVFSRHGARTPELKDVYPNDPYKLEHFSPKGYGQLTEQGIWQAFKIGQLLRNRYDHFCENISSANMVYAQSTNYGRTRTSALRILLGLFSSSPSQQELPSLIPVNSKMAGFDFFLQRPNSYCPAYSTQLEMVLASKSAKDYVEEKRSLFEYLTNSAGKPIKTLQDVFDLYQTLTAETNMNLTLPDWTKNVYPAQITEVAIKQCQLENSTPLLRKLNGGRSLQMVLKNMVDKTTERKLFLYTGHENNINNILFAMGLEESHFPNYSATVVFELHFLEIQQEYAVKVVHLKGVEHDFVVKRLEGCDVLCPLDKFLELTKDVVPVNYTRECESTKNLDP